MGLFRNDRKERPQNLLGGPGGREYVGMNLSKSSELDRGSRVALTELPQRYATQNRNSKRDQHEHSGKRHRTESFWENGQKSGFQDGCLSKSNIVWPDFV